jgi:hypothetical protein
MQKIDVITILNKSILINSIFFPIVFIIGFSIPFFKTYERFFFHNLLEINNLVFAFFSFLSFILFVKLYYSHNPEEVVYFSFSSVFDYFTLIGLVLSQLFWLKFFRTTVGLPFLVFIISTVNLSNSLKNFFNDFFDKDLKTQESFRLGFYLENIFLPISFYLLVFFILWKLYLQ